MTFLMNAIDYLKRNIEDVKMIKRICVYCGSSRASMDKYIESVNSVAQLIVDNDMELVYGGSSVGLMGAMANSVLEKGGNVIGVIPKEIVNRYEVAHSDLTKLYVVDGMHERKQKMTELSDAFIALPGGLGTFEEILEIMTWNQLGFINKPAGFLNSNGFYDKLKDFFNHVIRENFIYEGYTSKIIFESNAKSLFGYLMAVK